MSFGLNVTDSGLDSAVKGLPGASGLPRIAPVSAGDPDAIGAAIIATLRSLVTAERVLAQQEDTEKAQLRAIETTFRATDTALSAAVPAGH